MKLNRNEPVGFAPHTGPMTSRKVSMPLSFDIASIPETLSSNTGLDSQPAFSIALDWLDITFRKVHDLQEVEAILSEVCALLDDEIDFSPTRPTMNGKAWDGSGRGLKGTLVFYDAGSSSDEQANRWPALKIAMSGSVIAATNQQAVAYWLSQRAIENELDCTRIDIALDDHNKFVNLGKITQALRAENFFNASETEVTDSGKKGEDRGTTLYFGSKKSDIRLCIYDKSIESKGRLTGNRWEGRFRRKAARVALFQWLEANLHDEAAVISWATDTVVGVIDFRDCSTGDPNRLRCPVLDWFSEFCNELRATPAKLRIPVVAVTVQRSIDWVIKSVAPTLSLLKSVLTTDFNKFLEENIYEGGIRLANVKRRLIDSTDKQQLVY